MRAIVLTFALIVNTTAAAQMPDNPLNCVERQNGEPLCFGRSEVFDKLLEQQGINVEVPSEVIYIGGDLWKAPTYYHHDEKYDPTLEPSRFVSAEGEYEGAGETRSLVACHVQVAKSDSGTVDDLWPGEDGYPTYIYVGGTPEDLDELENELRKPDGPCAE